MEVVFVYPTYYGMSNTPALKLQTDCEDGYTWFGVEEAIENYLAEKRLDIKNVMWQVWIEEQSKYETIEAVDINDWTEKFNDLGIWI